MSALSELLGRVTELERKFYGSVRHGSVSEVDTAAGTVRLLLGEATGGGDLLSPAIPYAQQAGALRAHIPPVVGQNMTLVAPSGDWQQAIALPMTWNDANPPPSLAADQNVITFGAVSVTIRADGIQIVVGGVTLMITAGGLQITGGSVSHQGKNIGSTHTHGGVDRGGGDTNPPN